MRPRQGSACRPAARPGFARRPSNDWPRNSSWLRLHGPRKLPRAARLELLGYDAELRGEAAGAGCRAGSKAFPPGL
eukprot:2334078-Lingulodinium_polyedra.AAC.1